MKIQPDDTKKLLAAYDNFCINLTLTDFKSEVERFLLATSTVRLSPSQRLIGLAHKFAEKIGWENVCLIYERAIQLDGSREGLYVTWLSLSLLLLDESEQKGEGQTLKKIVEQSIQILDRAGEQFPNHLGFVITRGLLQYRFGAFFKDDSYVLESLRLYKLAIEIQQADGEEIENRIRYYQGDSEFFLLNWSGAYNYYQLVNQKVLKQEENESVVANVLEKMAYCQQKLQK